MPLFWLVIAFLCFIVFVICVYTDRKWYEEEMIRSQKRAKAMKEAKKKKIKEFKWPEYVPYMDFL